MLVKEIIINASTLIGREDVVQYLKDEQIEPEQKTIDTVDVMVRLLNIVVSELASSFVPMIVNEDYVAKNGKVIYSELNYRPKEILKAYDDAGNDKLLGVEHTFARVGETNVQVEYACFPPELTVDGEINYTEKDVTKNTLAYGLLAEYAITQGCFKDAVMWHDRYADNINELVKPKNAMLKRREWA